MIQIPGIRARTVIQNFRIGRITICLPLTWNMVNWYFSTFGNGLHMILLFRSFNVGCQWQKNMLWTGALTQESSQQAQAPNDADFARRNSAGVAAGHGATSERHVAVCWVNKRAVPWISTNKYSSDHEHPWYFAIIIKHICHTCYSMFLLGGDVSWVFTCLWSVSEIFCRLRICLEDHPT